MNELALFAGAGGGILGGHLLGWRTVCAVELEPYPASVLCARQNDGLLPPFPVWDDICTFDGKPWRGIVDVVSGGFPCQDISAAGKGAGINGSRSGLWREMARIIGEVRPRFVFVENSPMLVNRGLGTVLGDLAALGYDAEWGVLSAADVGAPHKRDRIWIVAYANGNGDSGTVGRSDGIPQLNRAQDLSAGKLGRASDDERECALRGYDETDNVADSDRMRQPQSQRRKQNQRGRIGNGGNDVADTRGGRCLQPENRQMEQSRRAETVGTSAVANPLRDRPQGQRQDGRIAGSAGLCGGARCDQEQQLCDAAGAGFSQRTNKQMGRPRQIAQLERPDWWSTEPDVGRVVNGLAARVDRLKAIGNGQVPLCAATAFELLARRAGICE